MIYFKNSMLGMRGFHLLVPESQTSARTQIYDIIFAGLRLIDSFICNISMVFSLFLRTAYILEERHIIRSLTSPKNEK